MKKNIIFLIFMQNLKRLEKNRKVPLDFSNVPSVIYCSSYPPMSIVKLNNCISVSSEK